MLKLNSLTGQQNYINLAIKALKLISEYINITENNVRTFKLF